MGLVDGTSVPRKEPNMTDLIRYSHPRSPAALLLASYKGRVGTRFAARDRTATEGVILSGFWSPARDLFQSSGSERSGSFIRLNGFWLKRERSANAKRLVP